MVPKVAVPLLVRGSNLIEPTRPTGELNKEPQPDGPEPSKKETHDTAHHTVELRGFEPPGPNCCGPRIVPVNLGEPRPSSDTLCGPSADFPPTRQTAVVADHARQRLALMCNSRTFNAVGRQHQVEMSGYFMEKRLSLRAHSNRKPSGSS